MATDRPIVNTVLANRPIIRAIALSVLGPKATDQQVQEAAERIASDPVVVNEVSAEPLTQSRTWMGNAGAVLAWLALLFQFLSGAPDASLSDLITDLPVVLNIVAALGAHVVAGVGRAKSNLAPMTWWKPWTWFGIGR